MAELSLCMIVRDESEVLARCLDSVAGVADEIVIVDTGSKDDTVTIARSFGARVEFFEWIDDFAAARNCSFDFATCPYILWLDADDVVLPADREKLLDLKPRLERDVYWMRYDYAQDHFGNSICLFSRERIVRNTPRIRWKYPAHTLLSHDRAMTAEHVDVTISHRRTEAGMVQDRGRGLRILQRAAGEPAWAGVPRMHYHLAREYAAAGMLREAIRAYETVLAIAESWPGLVNAQEDLARCYRRLALEDPPRAAEHRCRARVAAGEALRLDSRRAEPRFVLGRIAEDEGDAAEAISWYEQALRPLPETVGEVIPWDYTIGPAVRLCSLWAGLGDLARADHYNEMALRWSPRDPLLHLTRRRLRDAGPRVLQTGSDSQPG